MSPRVLFAASECAPLVKTGGLADVAGSLPAALRRLGVDVRVLLPGYRDVLARLPEGRPVAEIAPFAGLPGARLLAGQLPGGVPLWVIDCPELYARGGGPYQDSAGAAWPDNALRFGLFGRVAAWAADPQAPLPWRAQVVHAHDWQAGLAAAYLRFASLPAASVVTIHNLAFSGSFEPRWLGTLGLPAHSWSTDGVEFYGQLSFLKAGLRYADAITTVSPTYAREIRTAAQGMGFEGLLEWRAGALHGILNGIDTAVWNPVVDPLLAARYGASSLPRKRINRRELQRRLGLAPDRFAPIFGMVSRLTDQKGADLVAAIADEIVAAPAQLAVVGSGEAVMEARFRELAQRHPGRIGVFIGFDESLAHLVEAGADAFLMPSRFEPCGMNQMFSQRYGTPPIVHATGGLVDSVVDCTPATLADRTATGFVFDACTPTGLRGALARALLARRQRDTWRQLQRNGMVRDFGWETAAAEYAALYASLAAGHP